MSTHRSETDPGFEDAGNDDPNFERVEPIESGGSVAFGESADGPRQGGGGRFADGSGGLGDGDEVDRVETLIRLLYTLLFFLIFRVVEAALGVIVFFQLVFALVSNRTPNPAINSFARRVIEYGYQIGHYVTYNRDQPPFPFDELPSEDDEGDKFLSP